MNRPFLRPPAPRRRPLRGTRPPGLAHVAAAPAQDHVPALFVISDRRRRSRTRLAAPPVSGGTGASGRPARATGRHDRKRGDRRRILRCRGILRGQELASGSVQWAQSAARLPRDARCEDALLRCYERDGWDEEALAIRRQRLEHHPGPIHGAASGRKNAKRDPALYRAELFAWAEQREQAKHKHALEQHRHLKFSDPLATPLLDVSVRVQWLLAEKKRDDAWLLARMPDTQCDVAVLEQLADAMPKQRADAARLLQRIFEHEMKMASSPMTDH